MEHIESYIQKLETELLTDHYSMTEQLLANTGSILSALETDSAKQDIELAESRLSNLAEQASLAETAVFLYSAAFSIREARNIFEKMLEYCLLNKEKFAPNSLHYLFNQFISIIFLKPDLNLTAFKIKLQLLIDHVLQSYEKEFADCLHPIPEDQRDPNQVIVFTEQFLSFHHGPTKSAADRCQILMEHMGKHVLLVNTAELLSNVGRIPFVNSRQANYEPNYSNTDYIEWKYCRIPYLQCGNDMPNPESVRILLNMIREIRPAFIISIGPGKIVASLASKIVPTLSIGMVFSDLSITGVKYQALGRSLNEDDQQFLAATGRTSDSVITGTFGFSINTQKVKRTRESANLPAEAWLAAIVGARLDYELTEEFWDMAETLSSKGIEFLLIGPFDESRLENIYAARPALCGKIYCTGFADDPLSYIDLCDLYINPVRRGGGTSCVEALSLGIPVITTSYGDVAVAAGEAFWTESYDTMPALIERYLTDFDFYVNQSTAAGNRATDLLNAEKCFVQIVNDFLKRAK